MACVDCTEYNIEWQVSETNASVEICKSWVYWVE